MVEIKEILTLSFVLMTSQKYIVHVSSYDGFWLMVFNAVRFIVGGNWSIRRKPLTCHKSPTNLISISVSSYDDY
jgi:hypothetical protein